MKPSLDARRVDWAREKVEQLPCFEECDTNKNWVPTTDVIKLLRAERAAVRLVVYKEIKHQGKYKDDVSRGYVQEMLRDLLAKLKERR